MVSAAYLIPLLPLVGFGLLLLFGRKLGDPLAGWLATAAIGGSFAAAVVTWAGLLSRTAADRHFTQTFFTWIPVAGVVPSPPRIVPSVSAASESTMSGFAPSAGAA